MVQLKLPRVIISASNSDAGKTAITVGLIAALRKRGYKVQPFKIGPDFIDPGYHTSAASMPSRNLDSWLMDTESIVKIFTNAACESDISVIEGVRGLYDGISPVDEFGSTAHIAKILNTPVILVANVQSITKSAAAIVLGFKCLDQEIDIAGVILNKVKNELHAKKAKESIQHFTKLPVLGTIPRSKMAELPKRHLGLIPTAEMIDLQTCMNNLRELVEAHVDLDRVVSIAQNAPDLPGSSAMKKTSEVREKGRIKIGIAMDDVFTFYYADNIDALRLGGAEIVKVNTLKDSKLPDDLAGLILGGGYPECFAPELEANVSLRNNIKRSSQDGMPIYAECGGLMYLSNSITTLDGRRHAMVGVIDGETMMTDEATSLGYVELKVTEKNPFSEAGDIFRGHEFHYSKLQDFPMDVKFCYKVLRGKGIDGGRDGILVYNTLASFAHVHVVSYPKIVTKFLDACKAYSRK